MNGTFDVQQFELMYIAKIHMYVRKLCVKRVYIERVYKDKRFRILIPKSYVYEIR